MALLQTVINAIALASALISAVGHGGSLQARELPPNAKVLVEAINRSNNDLQSCLWRGETPPTGPMYPWKMATLSHVGNGAAKATNKDVAKATNKDRVAFNQWKPAYSECNQQFLAAIMSWPTLHTLLLAQLTQEEANEGDWYAGRETWGNYIQRDLDITSAFGEQFKAEVMRLLKAAITGQ